MASDAKLVRIGGGTVGKGLDSRMSLSRGGSSRQHSDSMHAATLVSARHCKSIHTLRLNPVTWLRPGVHRFAGRGRGRPHGVEARWCRGAVVPCGQAQWHAACCLAALVSSVGQQRNAGVRERLVYSSVYHAMPCHAMLSVREQVLHRLLEDAPPACWDCWRKQGRRARSQT